MKTYRISRVFAYRLSWHIEAESAEAALSRLDASDLHKAPIEGKDLGPVTQLFDLWEQVQDGVAEVMYDASRTLQ